MHKDGDHFHKANHGSKCCNAEEDEEDRGPQRGEWELSEKFRDGHKYETYATFL